jgi:hypothetical protein
MKITASGLPVLSVGIITRRSAGRASFAVPVESVIGLADGVTPMPLGNGSALRLPAQQPRSPASKAVASTDPKELIRSAKTFMVESHTVYFTAETLERELTRQAEFEKLGLVLVKDARVADMLVVLDRPLFTWTFTYSVTDKRTSIVLDTGKVTAPDGNTAAGKIAKELVAAWTRQRAH